VIVITSKNTGESTSKKSLEGVEVIGYGKMQNSFGEEVIVSGKITDNNGKPLPDVAVVIKGKPVGTITDSNGNYQIKTEDNSILIFSKPGYIKPEISVAGKTEINLKLLPDTESRSTQNTGINTLIRVRATGSSTGEGNPLILVEGKEIKKIEDINPDSIESMTVLKGETATAMYGEKAKDGVIIIDLKKTGTNSAKSELSNFLISIELKQNTVVLQGLNGCAFKVLTFTIKDNNPVPVDKFGMASPESGNSASEFLFNVEKVNDEIVLTGRKGTAWKSLSFKPPTTLHFINEFGVSRNQ
jgi:TonB-dependent SusC/RagA subfamily outer membrane receptor